MEVRNLVCAGLPERAHTPVFEPNRGERDPETPGPDEAGPREAARDAKGAERETRETEGRQSKGAGSFSLDLFFRGIKAESGWLVLGVRVPEKRR